MENDNIDIFMGREQEDPVSLTLFLHTKTFTKGNLKNLTFKQVIY